MNHEKAVSQAKLVRAEIASARAMGETMVSIANRLGVNDTTLTWFWKTGKEEHTVHPRQPGLKRLTPEQQRAKRAAYERARRGAGVQRKDRPNAAMTRPPTVAAVNKALATTLDVPPRPERSAVLELVRVMRAHGASRIVIDLDLNRVDITATESYPIGAMG